MVKTIEASKINFNTLSFDSSEGVNIKKTVLKQRIFEDGQWKDTPFYQLEELSNQKINNWSGGHNIAKQHGINQNRLGM